MSQRRAMRRRYVRVGNGYAVFEMLTCQRCGRDWDRPIRQGGKPKHCLDCKVAIREERKVAARMAWVVKRRIVLGPAACQGCRMALTWNGYAWENVVGDRHSCDNAQVGISDANSPDIMCDALLVADTSREGVPRLEVSAP